MFLLSLWFISSVNQILEDIYKIYFIIDAKMHIFQGEGPGNDAQKWRELFEAARSS